MPTSPPPPAAPPSPTAGPAGRQGNRALPAELFEQLFPPGVRMTAEFERWAELTEKLTAYADAS